MQPAVILISLRVPLWLQLWLFGSSWEAVPLTVWQPMPNQPGRMAYAASSPTHLSRGMHAAGQCQCVHVLPQLFAGRRRTTAKSKAGAGLGPAWCAHEGGSFMA